ncbi:MAG: GDP-mannose 4,6-dehydratase [Thermoplasmata archaeon]
MTRRVVITGGEGFIGSNLAMSLLGKGLEPVVYDCQPNARTTRDLSAKIDVIHGDVRDFENLRKAVQSACGIVHLAAVSRVIWGYEDPKRCTDVNVGGTANVLEAARLAENKPWVIYGSSREVYGEPTKLPVSEDDPVRPINIYGLSKATGETLCQLYNRRFGLNTGILRFSNVYGNALDQLDRVIPKFILNALNGRDLVIQGGGQCFDFTHIDDVVVGIEAMIRRLHDGSEPSSATCECYHLVTGQSTSLQQLVDMIGSRMEGALEVRYEPARSYDVERFRGDPTKASEELGFEASIGIEEGIGMTIDELRPLTLKENSTKASEPEEGIPYPEADA